MSKNNTVIAKAIANLLAEAPVKPAAVKVAPHPCGSFDFTVSRVFVKVSETVTATEILPGLTVETGTPRIRVELTSGSGVVREDFTMWTAQDGKKVWIGLPAILTALGSAEVTDLQGFAALIGKSATFEVRHETIPAKGSFPARTVATIRPEKKTK